MPFLRLSEISVLAVALICILIVFRNRRVRKKLPPTPPGIPFFGNMFQMADAARHIKFTEWAKQYGEIYHLQAGPQSLIVLNSAEVADELLSKRAKNYSSRPPAHVAFDLVSDKQRMVLMPYNDAWKVARKNVSATVGPSAIKRINVLQELESRVLMKDLLDYGDGPISAQPGQNQESKTVPDGHWFHFIRRFTTSLIMTVIYAERIHTLNDSRRVMNIYDIITSFLRVAQPGRYLADIFPFIRWLPDFLANWRVEGKRMHALEMELFGGLLEEHKANVKGGMTRDCFVSNYLQARADAGREDAAGVDLTPDGWMRDKFLAYTAGSMIEAASDTTASTLQTFLLYMLNHPSIMKKAQDELDLVVGNGRMPTWEDESNLPYLVACIKEVIRIRPTVNFAVPHTAEEDDEIRGYFIPKGSIMMTNVWAIQRDSNKYPNPTAFQPERFYTPDEPTRWCSGPDIKDRDHYIFGWGRRFCPGTYFAEAALFIACARIVWGFNMDPLIDVQTGKPVMPDVEDEYATWIHESINCPKVFPVIWRARDEKRVAVVRESFEDAQREWQMLGLEPDLR